MARRKKRLSSTIFLVIAIILFLTYYYLRNNTDLFNKNTLDPEAACFVDFIDCGQGDSILICSDGEVTLIDTTTGKSEYDVTDHLEERGITKIDHLVLTHPHEDHIGGADVVLDRFEVGTIYMRKPTPGTEPTSKVYIGLLEQIQDLGKTIKTADVGLTFECGAVSFEVIGPLEQYEETNDQSIILRAEIGDISFLFTGDQEKAAELDMVEQYGDDLDCTVLKVGHHGSSGSSCDEFLDAADPKYAMISCGVDNSYGHPHSETVSRLEERNIPYYRTDTQGTITVTTDGKTLDIAKEN